MSENQNLVDAKKAKNDEFYTRIETAEEELLRPDYIRNFAGKTILCNCNDGNESAFVVFFRSHFLRFGLKSLIYTTFGPSAKKYEWNGKEVKTTPLLEGGDFRSEECVQILKEADLVVSNPPFSLFREYVKLLTEYQKDFIIIGSRNAVSCRGIFPLFRQGQIRFGYTLLHSFHTPGDARSFGNVGWYTNLPIDRVCERLPLTKRYHGHHEDYPVYDNYPAIEVGKVENIPRDYPGSMGVPLSFLEKYNPEQFSLVGSSGELAHPVMINGKRQTGRFYLNGKRLFDRVVIRKRY